MTEDEYLVVRRVADGIVADSGDGLRCVFCGRKRSVNEILKIGYEIHRKGCLTINALKAIKEHNLKLKNQQEIAK